jgi:transcriptional regulator with XRE-family HTH domain
LARKAGIGKSTIFNLVRAQGNPAIDTLWSLARALEVPIGALFVDSALSDVRVMRLDEAPVLVGEVSHPAARDAGLVEHEVGMTGTVVITVDNESISLPVGDRMSFPAERSHRYATPNEPATLLALPEYVQ